MTKPLSNDIRERLVSAVDSGLSRRSAARRFGVAASTAIKWVDQWRRTGDVGPRPQGGDHRSHRIEAHAEEILALVNEMPDITLGEIAAQLDAGHGLTVAQSTVWRLLDRHGMTFKKKPRTRPSNSELTSCTADRPGSTPSPIWSPSGWCSLTRPALRPRWPGAMADPCAVSVAGRRCLMGTGRPPPLLARSALKA